MEQSFFIDSTDGVLKVFTTPIPKMPVRPESGSKHTLPDGSKKTLELGGDFGYEKALAKYHAALELAKKEAVEVDESFVLKILRCITGPVDGDMLEYVRTNLVRNKIYTINMEEEIEVVESVCGCSGPSLPECAESEPCKKKVARIIPKKAEVQETPLQKLKTTIIEFLRKQPDKPYLATHGRSFTTHELSSEIEKDTAIGLDMLNSMVLLAADLIVRGKETLPKKAEESEDELWREVFGAYAGKWHHADMEEEDEILSDLSKHFEIKRKA